MKQVEAFWENIKKEEMAILATAAKDSVTMRTFSPVYYEGTILLFTGPGSTKYQQMKENPACCVAIGGCFLEAKAEILGPTMQDENAALREVYAQKFSGAFDEGIEFGGRASEFIRLHPVRMTGWNFENGEPTGPFEHIF